MKKEKKRLWARFVTTTLSFLLCMVGSLQAQEHKGADINGKIYELDEKGQRIPLGYATLYFPDYGIGATSDDHGNFIFKHVPMGKAKIQVQYVGKLSIDTLVNVNRDTTIDFTLRNEDFKLTQIGH